MSAGVFALRSKGLYADVLKRGRAAHTTFFSMRFLESSGRALFVGVAAGKKVARSAVMRNKIRRRAREHVRRCAQQKETRAGAILIFPQQAAASLSRAGFYQELERALAKAGVFRM